MVILLPGQAVHFPMDYGLKGRKGVVGYMHSKDGKRVYCRAHMAEQRVMPGRREAECPYCYATYHTSHWCGKCELCKLFALVYAGTAPWMTKKGRAAYLADVDRDCCSNNFQGQCAKGTGCNVGDGSSGKEGGERQ